jgi:hypothetical protein
MSLRRLLTGVVIFDALLTLVPDAIAVANVSPETTLLAPVAVADFRIPESIMYFVACIYFIILIASYVGLIRAWSPARTLYVVAWLISLTIESLGPGEALTGFGVARTLLVGLSGGFLLGLVYFTPLAKDFARSRLS